MKMTSQIEMDSQKMLKHFQDTRAVYQQTYDNWDLPESTRSKAKTIVNVLTLAIENLVTLDALKARAQQIIDAGPILGQEPRLAAWFILSGEKTNVPPRVGEKE